MFLRDRRWGGLEHVCEVSRATSENPSMNQAQHCDVSTCLQRGEVEVQERVFVRETAFSKEARLKSHRFQPVWFWPGDALQGVRYSMNESTFDLYTCTDRGTSWKRLVLKMVASFQEA